MKNGDLDMGQTFIKNLALSPDDSSEDYAATVKFVKQNNSTITNSIYNTLRQQFALTALWEY